MIVKDLGNYPREHKRETLDNVNLAGLNAYEREARLNAIDQERRQNINLRLGLPPLLTRKQRRAALSTGSKKSHGKMTVLCPGAKVPKGP